MAVTGTLHARPRSRLLAPALAGAGLVVLLIGTFLPWLRSGGALRNSYQADGVIRRLLAPNGPAGALLTAWPLVGACCAVAAAGYALGLRRTALALAAVTAVAAGAVAVPALILAPRSYASVIAGGPAVTLAGSALVLAGVVTALSTRDRTGGSSP